MNLHDEFEPSYINMGRNGIDPVGHITDAEGDHVCTAPTNEIADMIVDALNRDDSICTAIASERRDVWMNFHTPAAQKAAEDMLKRIEDRALASRPPP